MTSEEIRSIIRVQRKTDDGSPYQKRLRNNRLSSSEAVISFCYQDQSFLKKEAIIMISPVNAISISKVTIEDNTVQV